MVTTFKIKLQDPIIALSYLSLTTTLWYRRPILLMLFAHKKKTHASTGKVTSPNGGTWKIQEGWQYQRALKARVLNINLQYDLLVVQWEAKSALWNRESKEHYLNEEHSIRQYIQWQPALCDFWMVWNWTQNQRFIYDSHWTEETLKSKEKTKCNFNWF